MTLVPIMTERLRIRALHEGDLASVFAIVGDRRVAGDATWLQPDLESCRGYLARRMANENELGYSVWGVERVEDDGLIGLAGFFPHGDEVELGYAFRVDQWGHGYATEAVRAVLDAAQVLGHRVYATIRSSNSGSIAVAEKVGLVHAGEVIEDERGTKLIFRSA